YRSGSAHLHCFICACAEGLILLTRFTGECAPIGTGDYMIDVWTGGNGEKGVPNSSVTAIAQTPDGYLWAGTYNGLARFDGVRFVHFDPNNTPELKRSRIRRSCWLAMLARRVPAAMLTQAAETRRAVN